MKKRFEGKNVIVTGGSGGIGNIVVKGFLREGAQVLVVDTKESLQYKTVDVDISNEDQVFGTIKSRIDNIFDGQVDVLVNAAGIRGPVGKLEELDLDLWKETIAVNLLGTVNMCALVIPFMKNKKRGNIINFSGGGEGPLPKFTAYSSSKGAILRFTESLAAELAEHNIFINAVAPGLVDTPIAIGEDFVSPNHVCDLILFLASGKTKNLTGKLISAIHDDWKNIPNRLEILNETDIYNIRRIKFIAMGHD